MIHSNVSRTLRRCAKEGQRISVQELLDSFKAAVGTTGTLLFPLFNFDFANGIPFDIRSTPSKMGSLTEAARLDPLTVRTGHPMYSFAVLGALQERFRAINNISGYGEDSPFALLRQLNGKIAVLDLDDQASMTFYHHVEEMHRVDYRYFKSFEGPYADSKGEVGFRRYLLFVRRIDKGILTFVNPAGEMMWRAGLYSGNRPGVGSGLRVVSASAMFDFVSEIIKSGKAENVLYRVDPNLRG
ncbi:MAG TPA: AAC(3) family N-acetyltransferase [Elusimicrobiota bacterium]|nr:AAC(3) family N-acetyltransferase [Elusimicrobiota bacterium]